MKRAEFEEREYETPLYNQLANSTNNVWAPGQVFEGHIGIDFSLFLQDQSLFSMHRYRSIPPGAVLSRYRWPFQWFKKRKRKDLPSFRLNLFLQAKRPEWGTRPSKALCAKGIGKPFWRIGLDSEQQNTLELVAATLGRRAVVAYAAPVFHSHKDLFRYTRTGTMVAQSTFPSAASLAGHGTWIYSQPGAVGVRNPELTPLREPSLESRIQELLRGKGDTVPDWHEGIMGLARDVVAALESNSLGDTPRRASFFDRVRAIRRELEDLRDSDAAMAYSTVLAFCDTYLVNWFVVG